MRNTKFVLNNEKKGIELYFTEKPEQKIINYLKTNKWKWHRVKRCWYAKQTPNNLSIAENITNGNVQLIPEKEENLPFKVGEILYTTWGYEQTNVDFYQVTRCTQKTVWIRPIADKSVGSGHGSGMDGFKIPIPHQFIGEEIKKKIKYCSNGENTYIQFEHGNAHRWDGKPVHYSWYY